MRLDGPWYAAVADDVARRNALDTSFDGAGWASVPVPGHWRASEPLRSTDGPVIYRTRIDSPGEAERWWLCVDGVFYESDVWLDGDYIGDTEGYFIPHAFDVSEMLRTGDDHVLVLEVSCPPALAPDSKRSILGVFQHWRGLDPNWNPGGPWREIRLEKTGDIRLSTLRTLVVEASAERAVISLRSMLDVRRAATATVHTVVRDSSGTVVSDQHHEHRVATGSNRLKWSVEIESPQLWWPYQLGEQPLYDITVEVFVEDSDTASHTRHVRTGVRRVELDDWIFKVNGERLFLKGTNYGPTRAELAAVKAEDVRSDLDSIKSANLNLVRLLGHVAVPHLYDAADELGIMLWQDLPLHRGYVRGIRKQVSHQARAAVDQLGAHPSLVVWSGHDEPGKRDTGAGSFVSELVRHQVPSWDRSVLDVAVKRAIAEADPTRPVNPHSGVLPHVGGTGTDSHLYFGWRYGTAGDLSATAARFPRLVRFVSAFGAQSVPPAEWVEATGQWPDLDWNLLQERHGLELESMRLHVDPNAYDSFVDWVDATQEYQAELLARQIEMLRRLKYSPTGGFAQYYFADAHPSISFALVDHERRPKKALQRVAAACAPVIVVADLLPETLIPGDALSLDVHVVNDLRHEIADARLDAQLAADGSKRDWSWAGEMAPDSVTRIADIPVVIPGESDELSLSLRLTWAGGQATNVYRSRIQRARGR